MSESEVESVQVSVGDASSDISRRNASDRLRENVRDETGDAHLEESLQIVDDTTQRSTFDSIPRAHKKTIIKHKDAYRKIYNRVVEEAAGQGFVYDDATFEPSSQIGASAWTSLEKELFFHNLSRLGRDNIKGLANTIGSKSEMEVHQYIQMLSDGVIEGGITHGLDGHLTTEVPAASEVSGACEALLEAAADELAKDQLAMERRRESKKHGDHWLLTEEVAAQVEEQYNDIAGGQEVAEKQIGDHDAGEDADTKDTKDETLSVPAAELLNLPVWLELSEYLMWQSQDGVDNWTNYTTTDDETPSMYHTAFQDFHNLTVSVTRRLLQASIFQAQSRIRARDRDVPSATLYPADIRAAGRILGMREDRCKFWGTMPRRHGIKVYVRKKKSKKTKEQTHDKQAKEHRIKNLYHMPYDEVEAELGVAEMTAKEGVDEDAISTVEDDLGPSSIYDDSDMWTEVSFSGGDGDEDSDNELEDRTFHADDEDMPADSSHTGRLDIEKQLNSQAEAFDQQSSAIEEARLWGMFELAPPVEIKDEDIPLSGALGSKRKPRYEHKDWRGATEYQAEWERPTGQARTEEFAIMQQRGEAGRKRRRLQRDQGVPRRRRLNTGRKDIRGVYESTDEDEEVHIPRAPSPVEYHTVAWSAGHQDATKRQESEPRSHENTVDAKMMDATSPASQRGEHSQPSRELTIGEMIANGMFPAQRSRERSRSAHARSTASTPHPRSATDSAPPSASAKGSSASHHSRSREGDAMSGADDDVKMEDESDAQSESSDEIDLWLPSKPAQKSAQKTVRKVTPDTETDGEEDGPMAHVRRKTRPERRREREERRDQEAREEI